MDSTDAVNPQTNKVSKEGNDDAYTAAPALHTDEGKKLLADFEHDAVNNPQDATVEVPGAVDFDVTVHDDADTEEAPTQAPPANVAAMLSLSDKSSIPKTTSNAEAPAEGRKRRKGKRRRMVRISPTANEKRTKPKCGLTLPVNQYEVTLVRRAICKRTKSTDFEKRTCDDCDDVEIYGDTSLGMKLSVVGGKVIVQTLNALSDGRASPAQLAGLIKRGDVLLSINGVSIVNLPIDHLMNSLSPLSTPDASGRYQKRLKLRLEAGGGLAMLVKSEEAQKDKKTASDLASDMLSLFPLVDQLSGMPFLEGEKAAPKKDETKIVSPPSDSFRVSLETRQPIPRNGTFQVSPSERISQTLADLRKRDRDQAVSAFFTWNQKQSSLMRCDVSLCSTTSVQSVDASLTKEEYVERGKRAILGANALTNQVETIDSGKDIRSFRSWKTTLSLRSRASTRRRNVLDAFSLSRSVSIGPEEKSFESRSDNAENQIDSTRSLTSDEEEKLDGDELLLRLAAYDEVWRRQVIEFLDNAGSLSPDTIEEDPAEDSPVKEDPFTASGFSSFLLGENVSKILTKRKKTRALPPEEVTAVLFDLSTKLSSSVPDEIAPGGMLTSSRSYLVPFIITKRPAPDSREMLATQFLLDEALPAWTKTFRPLPWDQRRVLWPVYKNASGGSTASSTISDDLLTLDTMSTNLTSMASKHRMRKNLREQIEDQALDVDTREETCFLLTYYFTQSLLPPLKKCEADTDLLEKAKDFVCKFGAYLKLHTCLAYAASVRACAVIDLLLDLAKYDPRHREIMKYTSKTGSLVLYEESMLSAVVQRLHMLRAEVVPEQRQTTIDLCAAAYPDVQSWQVRKQCLGDNTDIEEAENLSELYYTYLSLLLHPIDGHETARKDSDLIKDWCDLSVKKLKSESSPAKCKDYKKNFFDVASRASSNHKAYRRDLVHLLQLSMDMEEFDLALDLADEILHDVSLSENTDSSLVVLRHLRTIGRRSLKINEPVAARSIRRILKLFRKTTHSRSKVLRETFNVPSELLRFIRYNLLVRDDKEMVAPGDLELIEFFAEEAIPDDLLRALANLDELAGDEHNILPVIQTILCRAAHESDSSEMSVALMRVKHARMDMEQNIESKPSREVSDSSPGVPCHTIWHSMSHGMLTIAK